MMLNFNEPTCAITGARRSPERANLDLFIAQDFQSSLQFSFIYTYTPLANRILFLINLPLIKFLTQIFSAAG
jgi:hypothetical protein